MQQHLKTAADNVSQNEYVCQQTAWKKRIGKFDIALTAHHDKLYNRTKEMHFSCFIFDKIFYIFRIGKLFIIRRQCCMQRLVCIMHSCRPAAMTMKMEEFHLYRHSSRSI